jgi:hypothetical protein
MSDRFGWASELPNPKIHQQILSFENKALQTRTKRGQSTALERIGR